jgi:molybdopterin converting factor small subunit
VRNPYAHGNRPTLVRLRVHVLFFASAREAVGARELYRSVPKEGMLLRDLLHELSNEFPRLTRILAVSRLVRNGEYVQRAPSWIAPGDEVAIHPPYSGG